MKVEEFRLDGLFQSRLSRLHHRLCKEQNLNPPKMMSNLGRKTCGNPLPRRSGDVRGASAKRLLNERLLFQVKTLPTAFAHLPSDTFNLSRSDRRAADFRASDC